jgi:hypothetical protein
MFTMILQIVLLNGNEEITGLLMEVFLNDKDSWKVENSSKLTH